VRFNRIDDVASIASSVRTSSIRDLTNKVDEEDNNLNFQQEEMKNIREKIFLKKVVKQLQSLIAPNKPPKDIT